MKAQTKREKDIAGMLRYGYVAIDTTTTSGFPVTLWGLVCGAEPDVGIMRSYLDEMLVYTRKGYSASFLKLSSDEETRLEERFWDGLRDREAEEKEYWE